MSRHVLYVNWDAFDSRYIGRVPTPVLDRLTTEGVLYRTARAGIPTITPCMQTSIVTGAWPAVHGNTYRYFDQASGTVCQTGRENSAETIAEAAERSGLTTASVQQFTLRGRGTYPDNPQHLYVEPGGGMARRLQVAQEILRSGPAPRFLAFYADDLDAIGHNHQPHPDYDHHAVASTDSQRMARTLERLAEMDRMLGRLIEAMPSDTALVLTTDHGMVGFQGRSVLPEIIAALRAAGLVPEVLATGMAPATGTDLALTTVGLQVQLRWVDRPRQEVLAEAVGKMALAEWFGGVMDRAELDRRGAHPHFADCLLWPREGFHCHVQDEVEFPPLGGHETPLAGTVPLLLWGSGVRQLGPVGGPVETISAAPALAHLLGIRPPAQSTARSLPDALQET